MHFLITGISLGDRTSSVKPAILALFWFATIPLIAQNTHAFDVSGTQISRSARLMPLMSRL
jgi:hypothetical protein